MAPRLPLFMRSGVGTRHGDSFGAISAGLGSFGERTATASGLGSFGKMALGLGSFGVFTTTAAVLGSFGESDARRSDAGAASLMGSLAKTGAYPISPAASPLRT